MIIRPVFKWFDIWIGVFIDRDKRRVYVLPFFCIGLCFDFGPEWIYGKLANGVCARRHTWTGEVHIRLWRTGDVQRGYTYPADWYYPAHRDHWEGFIPDK